LTVNIHPQALARMRQLIIEALEKIEIRENRIVFATALDILGPFSEFLAKTYVQWLLPEMAELYALSSIESALESRGYLNRPGILSVTLTPEQRTQVANDVQEVWSRLPIDYRFAFPLTGVSRFPVDIELSPGVTLTNVPRNEVDAESMQLSVTFRSLMNTAPEPEVPALVVVSRGIMQYRNSSEIPAGIAIRRAKIVIQLGIVQGIFSTGYTDREAPKFAMYTPSEAVLRTPGFVSLPASFASVLPRVEMLPVPEGKLPDTLSRALANIRTIVAREADWDPSRKQPANATPEQKYKRQIDQHCARVATAAEWLFDAQYSPLSATAFVQTAIAFEALYGGNKDEAIGQTLSNRLAYALGQSPQQREFLRESFSNFYDVRSAVVHSGATRLTSEQKTDLKLMQRVLADALQHELEIASHSR
jgi:hypothetical protein